MLQRGSFRSDLFARLQGFTLRLWPLAKRREDIGLLVADHLPRIAPARADDITFTAEAARALVAYAWPLNVRELVQVLTHAVALAQDGVIEAKHLPPDLTALAARPVSHVTAPSDLSAEDAALRKDLIERLRRSRGNVTAVARDMSKATMQLYRLMRRLEVDPKTFR
jgi:DNA-binding NtrC family response regulator